MLAIVPWVAAQPDGATIDEICRRFELDRDQLQACLDTVFMVGVHPYTPDALIDVIVDHDRVADPSAGLLHPPAAAHPGAGLRPASPPVAVPAGRARRRPRRAPGPRPGQAGRRPGHRLRRPWSTSTSGRRPPMPSALLQQAAAEGRTRRDRLLQLRPRRPAMCAGSTRGGCRPQQGRWYLEAWCHRERGRAGVPGRPDPVGRTPRRDASTHRSTPVRSRCSDRPPTTRGSPSTWRPGRPGWSTSTRSRPSSTSPTDGVRVDARRRPPGRGSSGSCSASVPTPRWSTHRRSWPAPGTPRRRARCWPGTGG